MKKFLFVLGGLLLVAGAILGLKAVQIGSLIGFATAMEKAGMPPTPVATRVAEAAKWEDSLQLTGSLRPVEGVTLAAEEGGTVVKIAVDNGAKVQKGDLLIALDTSQEQADLNSAEARLRLAALNLARTKGLYEKRITPQSDYDAAQAAFDEARASVDSLRALIDKKTIRAPFAGQSGIRLVNLGQTVKPGDLLVPVHSNDPIFVEFAVPQTRLAQVTLGQKLRVMTDGAPGPVEGAVTAINPVVDEASRTARVQGTLRNTDGSLRPGQFATVEVVMPVKREVVAIPQSAVVAAAYGDSVFVVEEKEGKLVARQQFVRLGAQRGDFVEVVKGLKAGERVVSAGAFKLNNGAAVMLDDQMQPEPELQPKVDNS